MNLLASTAADLSHDALPGSKRAAAELRYAVEQLGEGNGDVYSDVYWQYLAYEYGGIKQIQALFDAGTLAKDYKTASKMLSAWKLIADGKSSDGNELLLYHEQHDVLQPLVFDELKAQVAGKYLNKLVPALVPGGTSFSQTVPDGNYSVFDDRWKEMVDQGGVARVGLVHPNQYQLGSGGQSTESAHGCTNCGR